MVRRDKKGQAAMEFLMTYGWAILAAIIAIGVLAYFGVFSPGKFMPSACTINAPLGCDEFYINSTASTISMVIRNGAGDYVTISNIAVSGCTPDTTNYLTLDGNTNLSTLTCTGISSGSKFKGTITIAYIKAGGTLSQTATGTITGVAP